MSADIPDTEVQNQNEDKELTVDLTKVIKSTIREEIGRSIDAHVPKWIEGLKTNIPPAESSSSAESMEAAEFERKRADAARKELEGLTVIKEKLEVEKRVLEEKLQLVKLSSQQKEKKLHKIIIDNGLIAQAPIDEEVQKLFGQLKHKINQLVNKHLFASKTNERSYDSLPEKTKSYYVIGEVANLIYENFFSRNPYWYGFDIKTDNLLSHFERWILKGESRSALFADVVEWRVRTANLAYKVDPTSQDIAPHWPVMAADMYKFILSYSGSVTSEGMKRRASDIKLDLAEICRHAHSIALLFRRTNIEYKWMQDWRYEAGNDADTEIVGTVGYKTVQEASSHEEIKVVFGGVSKGGGASGSLREEKILLFKTDLLLGPFERY